MPDIPYSFCSPQELKQNIGFAEYADLIRAQSISKGFKLNMLFIGRRGHGTKTLINSLFSANIITEKRSNNIEEYRAILKENNISLNISLTTYHGFDIKTLEKHFFHRNKSYFESDRVTDRIDSRVHATIFLLPPDQITSQEIAAMKYISSVSNLIPVMAKSDTFIETELVAKRKYFKNLLKENKISTFSPPTFTHSDKNAKNQREEIISKTPLSIIASEKLIKTEKSGLIRVREYNWGTIYINTEPSNDFILLRKILISQNSMDLIHLTDTQFYNKFRYNYNKKDIEKSEVEKKLKHLRLEIEKSIKREEAMKENKEKAERNNSPTKSKK